MEIETFRLIMGGTMWSLFMLIVGGKLQEWSDKL